MGSRADGPGRAPCRKVGVIDGGLVGQPTKDLGGEMDGESQAQMLSGLTMAASAGGVTLLKVLFQVLASLSLLLWGKPLIDHLPPARQNLHCLPQVVVLMLTTELPTDSLMRAS